jgi:hypothetical protein
MIEQASGLFPGDKVELSYLWKAQGKALLPGES